MPLSFRGALWVVLLLLAARPSPAQSRVETTTLMDDVRFLSSDRLSGRMIGTPGADRAAAYLVRRLTESGLQAAPRGWYQSFPVAREALGPDASPGPVIGKNIIGILPGRDPALRNQIVIVGAHYDHLGTGEFGSLDPDSAGRIHNGADDNASGVAALIHIAAELALAPPARSVVFVGFSGEEEGLLGSAYYLRSPIFPLSTVYAMVNLDMVGRLRDNRLLVLGTGTAREFPALLDSLNGGTRFDLRKQGDGYGPSDQSSFFAAGRPVLHLFTDLHEDYHRTTDDWEKINVVGLNRVAWFATGLVRALANRLAPLTFVNLPPPPVLRATATTPGFGAYLGAIPDPTERQGGLRLSGVRPGSPADSAGLRAGDLITAIDGTDVTDPQALTNALRRRRPGDVVEIRILRNGMERRVQATLAARES
ncbi:MAG: M28 family peptidase [Gemmatimonadales bacterium]